MYSSPPSPVLGEGGWGDEGPQPRCPYPQPLSIGERGAGTLTPSPSPSGRGEPESKSLSPGERDLAIILIVNPLWLAWPSEWVLYR
jgi:hypothetical protein